METKINVAKILKNKPEGTKLWTDIFGSVTLYVVTDACDAFQVKHHNKEPWFDEDGKLYKEGVLCIYPSKSMRDWNKFAWKKGDVLKNTAYEKRVIFDGFLNDDYTYFKGKYPLGCSNKLNITYHEECNCFTGNYRLESTDAAQTYINTIEERLGGKLNLETLEIEKAQPEFKDGDIVCISGMGYLAYGIVKSIDNSSKKLEYYALNDMSTLKTDDWLSFEDKQIQPITETQQIILFEALAKEGKHWDAEKKQIVDLKPKVEFKPFDKVVVRDKEDLVWFADLFSHIDKENNRFACVGNFWNVCLPYNEETAKLIGTTNNVEG